LCSRVLSSTLRWLPVGCEIAVVIVILHLHSRCIFCWILYIHQCGTAIFHADILLLCWNMIAFRSLYYCLTLPCRVPWTIGWVAKKFMRGNWHWYWSLMDHVFLEFLFVEMLFCCWNNVRSIYLGSLWDSSEQSACCRIGPETLSAFAAHPSIRASWTARWIGSRFDFGVWSSNF